MTVKSQPPAADIDAPLEIAPNAQPQPNDQPQQVDAPSIQPDYEQAPQVEQVANEPPTAIQQPAEQSPKPKWQDRVPVENKSVTTKGMIFVFGFLGLFFLWAVLFPISSAVVSMGKIVSAGANKLIQHPTGGVVKEILARDGERVAKDQVLLVLNPATSQAELGRLEARSRMLRALQARLKSEQGENAFDKLTTVSGLQLRGTQTASTPQNADTEMQRIVAEQRREFEAGRKRYNAQLDAATSQAEALKDSREGLQARLDGEERQLAYTERELRKVRPLAAEGYIAKNRLWELERRRLEQVTAIGNLESEISSSNQRISEAEAKVAELEETDREKRSEELTRVIGELGEISDQLTAAQTAVTATELKAPVAGTVTNMTANTNGGVVAPGITIAEIVPDNTGLITEFRVAPQSLKSIFVGQEARITVTAFNQRTYEPIAGEVTYVSADSQTDEQTGEVYFLARAKLMANPDKNDGVAEVQPGMQTQVFALSEPRVFMDYLLQPIQDSFNKAFREK